VSDSNQSRSLTDLARGHLLLVALLLGFAAYMTWDQIYWWQEREDYSFGFLVPLFALYVVYDRWPSICSYVFPSAQSTSAPVVSSQQPGALIKGCEYVALAAFIAGLVLFAIGALLRSVTGPQNPASLAIAASFAGIMLSTIFIMSKEQVDGQPMPLKNRLALTALFLFPALIWLLSAPLVTVFEKAIRVFLLTKVTIVVFNLFDLLGYELEREGNVLLLPDGQVGVEEACSGIRSLTACLFAGSFLAAVFLKQLWKKILLVACAMLFAVLTNLLRSMFLTLWAYHNGSEAIDAHWVLPILGDIGSVHDVTGMAILFLTCVGLLLLLPIFNYSLPNWDEAAVDTVDGEADPAAHSK
jgi:exosortase